jgi:hypothetical protein
MVSTFREIYAVPFDDGVVFDSEAVEIDRVREEREYGGLRIKTNATMDGARVRVVIDIGFGDATEPGLTEMDLPVLLDFPSPHLRAYARRWQNANGGGRLTTKTFWSARKITGSGAPPLKTNSGISPCLWRPHRHCNLSFQQSRGLPYGPIPRRSQSAPKRCGKSIRLQSLNLCPGIVGAIRPLSPFFLTSPNLFRNCSCIRHICGN